MRMANALFSPGPISEPLTTVKNATLTYALDIALLDLFLS